VLDGVIFAFQVLPIIIFIASFFSILYYLRDAGYREGFRDRNAEIMAQAVRNR